MWIPLDQSQLLFAILLMVTAAATSTCPISCHTWQSKRAFVKAKSYRGGYIDSTSGDDPSVFNNDTETSTSAAWPVDSVPSVTAAAATMKVPPVSWPTKTRHTSDLIHELVERSGLSDDNMEAQELRELIMQRTRAYRADLEDASHDPEKKLPDPRRLLQLLAPKIPAIKHSPDISLRIQSARSDMDPGVAASLVGILAHVAEMYDKKASLLRVPSDRKKGGRPMESAAASIIQERRFEQLIECILCGIDVRKRMREHKQQEQQENHGDHAPENLEEILEEEHAKMDEGLSIRDACRAAWGIAILGVPQMGTLGNENMSNLLIALSLRIREQLLARIQQLRQDDLVDVYNAEKSVDDRLREVAEEIAEDAASAMWTFACVRVCTGMRFARLFEVCCSLLCLDPVAMRRRAQEVEASLETTSVGSSDVVDRLAQSEQRCDDRNESTLKRAALQPASMPPVSLPYFPY